MTRILLTRFVQIAAAALSFTAPAASPASGLGGESAAAPFDAASLPRSIGPRIIAIGESSHGNEDMLQARNRLIMQLVDREAISWVALETGYAEARLLDRFVRGDAGEPEEVATRGFTSGFGKLAGNVSLLRELRAANLTRSEQQRVGIIGIDLSLGGPLASAPTMAPAMCALEGVENPMRREALTRKFADAVKPGLAGPSVTDEQKAAFRKVNDRLQASLAPTASFEARACARIVAQSATVLDALPKVVTPGSIPSDAWISVSRRDEAMAANALAAFRRSTDKSVLLFAHTSHVLKSPRRGGQWSTQARPPRSMGEVLQERLRGRYTVIAQIERAPASGAAAPDLVDALAIKCAGPCVVPVPERWKEEGPAFRIGINGIDEQIVDIDAADGFLLVPSRPNGS